MTSKLSTRGFAARVIKLHHKLADGNMVKRIAPDWVSLGAIARFRGEVESRREVGDKGAERKVEQAFGGGSSSCVPVKAIRSTRIHYGTMFIEVSKRIDTRQVKCVS